MGESKTPQAEGPGCCVGRLWLLVEGGYDTLTAGALIPCWLLTGWAMFNSATITTSEHTLWLLRPLACHFSRCKPLVSSVPAPALVCLVRVPHHCGAFLSIPALYLPIDAASSPQSYPSRTPKTPAPATTTRTGVGWERLCLRRLDEPARVRVEPPVSALGVGR